MAPALSRPLQRAAPQALAVAVAVAAGKLALALLPVLAQTAVYTAAVVVVGVPFQAHQAMVETVLMG